ncbi:MAG: hypothetical protein HN904_06140 [Victivallales bacterium]|nr:hypothetical protein [Victivallales bacterium]MBT7162340.1 hypothetical protein [Victivallales bacterium]
MIRNSAGSGPETWTFADGVPETVRAYLASGDWQRDAELVKENRCREVFLCRPAGSGRAIYVKRDLPAGLVGRLKHSLRSKAEREFASLQGALAAGVAVAPPLGWSGLSNGGLLATYEVMGDSVLDLMLGDRVAEALADEFLLSLARFLKGLLRVGMNHPDMHGGNIVVENPTSHSPSFSLLDLYGVRVGGAVGIASKRWLIVWLVPLLERISPTRRQRVLDLITDGDRDAALVASWTGLQRHWAKARRHSWPGRRRRLLERSSLCDSYVDSLGSWLAMTFPARTKGLGGALAAYEARDPATVALLKEDRKRCVARVGLDHGTVIVKEYLRTSWRPAWYSPDRRGWLNTSRAHCLSVSFARCLAWGRGGGGSAYLVLEDVGELCLHDYVPRSCPTPALRRPWLERMADILASLHVRGCFHADLKVANWVAGPDARLRVVDCDDVRFYRTLPEWARERNLRQLAETCPPGVTAREKLRFLALYGRFAELPAGWVRAFAAQLG